MPRAQPGWWLDLEGPFPLEEPLSLARLRERADAIRDLLEELQAIHAGSLYFPFFFWGGRELRPMQPYLNKLPAEFVELFAALASAVSAERALPDAAGVDCKGDVRECLPRGSGQPGAHNP